MRKLIIYILSLSFIFLNLEGNAMQLANDRVLELRILTEKNTFKLGEPINIECRVKNISNNASKVINLFFLEDNFIRFDIYDAQGNRVNFLGKEIKIKIRNDNWTILYPNGFIGTQVNLLGSDYDPNKGLFYNFSKKGSYTIQAVYHIPSFGKNSDEGVTFYKGEIKSNIIKIAIE